MKTKCLAVKSRKVAIGFTLILLCAGCGAKQNSSSTQKKQENAKSKNPLEIEVTPDVRTQLKVGLPQYSRVAESLNIAGRVEADATRQARVGTPVKGRITDLTVIEGQHVKRGEVLATLYSTDLSDAQFAFVKAVSEQQLTQRAAERGKQLVDADVIGSAELQRRQAEVLQATAEVSALRQQLEALGMSDKFVRQLETTRKLNSTYQILSTITGTVLERSITIGQIIQPAEVAFLVADLSNVWLVADVPEQNASSLAVGKQVDAVVPVYPDEVIKGKISFVSATVNAETRTVRARMNLPNLHGRYKPAMLATMVLKDQPQRQLTIPVTAIVRENNIDYIYAQVGPTRYVMRPVTLGSQFGELRVVTDGVDADEKIVVDGAFHLNNERKRIALEGAS